MGKVKIQEFMTRNGLTQQGLADLIGVKMELVGGLEYRSRRCYKRKLGQTFFRRNVF